ncbi:amidohydrolase family protein [Herbaspirillum rhizosphaerae]|uniref:amidohydrolase family protein n=1 Tax=Herbaspirillum rhizosphaerae TaxID=346179 RepID=UPI00067E225A|nr:amidohydrolase family protein [Herbaspirillum rhizosphaerae]
MPNHPTLIVDLHTHLFNARCLPLAGIIANAMEKDASESRLARGAAKLLERLTESEYRPRIYFKQFDDSVNAYIEALSDLSAKTLTTPFAQNLSQAKESSPATASAMVQIYSDELYADLRELEDILIEEGGLDSSQHSFVGVDDISEWAKKIVRATFRRLEELITLRDEIENYAEFFFNMLHAEEHMAQTLIDDYGDDLPPLQFVHHMMDMQMAYVVNQTPAQMVKPKYDFYGVQLGRMQDLADRYQTRVFGFSAFDPRRPDWREIVESSCAKGFRGFKFYTAMGYLPIGNEDPAIEQRVLEFFRLCIARDIPVFTHCTPVGFQTRFRKGLNADPRNWEKLLAANNGEFAKLRLCFGHAGGGRADNNGFSSPGWVASEAEWNSPGNYAWNVARLCRKYENVYCEFAYITELIEGSAAEQNAAYARFEANLLNALTSNDGESYDFSQKIGYGSDWHMPSMVDHPRAYLNVFLKMFDDNRPLAAYRENFFWGNAYRYLKI